MDNFKNDIYPEEAWQTFQTSKVDSSEESLLTKAEIKPKKRSKFPVLTIQLILSICLLLFLFITKFIGAPVYSAIVSWYESEVSKSVIYNGEFEDFDFSEIFSTVDEA